MYRFFVEESQIYDGTVHITGSDVNHIKNVLRMRPGEKILVSTGGEKEYHCAVSDFPEGEVLAAVEESQQQTENSRPELYCFRVCQKVTKWN